jgi:hypothetical protein
LVYGDTAGIISKDDAETESATDSVYKAVADEHAGF